jgi:integrase
MAQSAEEKERRWPMSEEEKKRSYGDGRVFRQKRKLADGTIVEMGPYWIAYCRRGKPFRESAKTTNEKEARKLLKRRLEEITRPVFVGPSENKLGIEDLEKKVLADYEKNNRRSKKTVEFCFKPLKAFFVFDRLIDITPTRIEKYQTARLAEGAAVATINRQCAYLRRGFKLLLDANEISYVPRIKLLEGENIREGFLNIPDFEAAASKIKNDDTRDIVEFLYASAWRSSEAETLEWSKVDLHDWVIRLARKNSKNKKPRTLVLVGELKEIIERRLAKRLPDCPFVFHRNGNPVKSFRRAFKSACKTAGLTGLVPHDMRRSGVRNLRRAGNDEHDCMEISGHKTRAVFDRYDIIDEEDQRLALERQQAYKRQQMEQGRKVVPLRQVS